MKKQLLSLAFLITLSFAVSTSLQAADQHPARYVSESAHFYTTKVPDYTLNSAERQIHLLEKRNKELKRTKPTGYKSEIERNEEVIEYTKLKYRPYL